LFKLDDVTSNVEHEKFIIKDLVVIKMNKIFLKIMRQTSLNVNSVILK